MGNKTDACVEVVKAKSAKREAEVLAAINEMKEAGEKVTFYSVQKRTGASKSFLYKNETISKAIKESRSSVPGTARSEESKDAIIAALRLSIKHLQSKVRTLEAERGESYKSKYEKLLAENKELKEQLKSAYKY